MRLPQDKILHIDTECKDGKVNIVAEWQGEIVRCKDCKHSRVYGKTTQWLACESVMEGQATDPDGYCYHGERRKDGKETTDT